MLVNELVDGVSTLDEGMSVYFPDGKEVVSITVKDGKVYLSDEYPAVCPNCGCGFKDEDLEECPECDWEYNENTGV